MISKSRPTRGRIGTPYYIETIYEVKKSCRNCIYYENEDKSCSKKPIVLSEIGFNHYKNCKYFEESKSKSNVNINRDKKIGRVMRNIIENDGDVNKVAKSFNISLYEALVIYRDMTGDLRAMNEININRLIEYGLSNKQISKFYGVDEINIPKKTTKIKTNNKIEKNTSSNKFYSNKVSYNNENAIILKEASKDCCGLCNKLDKSSKVYYIDNNKGEDKDSILNMINLCNNCERKVSKNRSNYNDILKEKAEEIMDSIISYI